MNRVTVNQLIQLVHDINSRSRLRLVLQREHKANAQRFYVIQDGQALSPTLPTGQLYAWLLGFERGYNAYPL